MHLDRHVIIVTMAVVGPSPWRAGLDPGLVHMEFVVYKVAL